MQLSLDYENIQISVEISENLNDEKLTARYTTYIHIACPSDRLQRSGSRREVSIL
jgi:hypothetical protein